MWQRVIELNQNAKKVYAMPIEPYQHYLLKKIESLISDHQTPDIFLGIKTHFDYLLVWNPKIYVIFIWEPYILILWWFLKIC